jgi:hypothetical protein
MLPVKFLPYRLLGFFSLNVVYFIVNSYIKEIIIMHLELYK